MPNKKMRAVNKELVQLLQILPISSIIKAFRDKANDASER
jgi:hypothetical protein